MKSKKTAAQAPKPVFCSYCGSPRNKAHKPDCTRPGGRGGPKLHGTVRKDRYNVVIDPNTAEAIREEFAGISPGIAALWAFYQKRKA